MVKINLIYITLFIYFFFSGLKTEFKQEEPDPGYRSPTGSGPPPSLQNRKRPFEEKGKGFYEHRDDRRCVHLGIALDRKLQTGLELLTPSLL